MPGEERRPSLTLELSYCLQTGSVGMQLVSLEDSPQTYGTEMS